MAARRGRGRLGRDRRFAGPFDRHREWLNGPIHRVTARTETFVKERMHAETGKMQPVGIDDACMFLAVFANGSMGTFESTRYARGRKNYNTFELNGEAGSVFFDLEDPQYLQYFKYPDPRRARRSIAHLTGWQKVHVTNPEHPYMEQWWVPGCTIGYEHTFINALADFLQGSGNRQADAARLPLRRCKRKKYATPSCPAPRAAHGSRFVELSPLAPCGRGVGGEGVALPTAKQMG